MVPCTTDDIVHALRQVQDPDLRRDIVALNFVKDVQILDGVARFTVELTTPACPVKDQLKAECEQVVLALPGVDQVEVTMTAQTRARATQAEDLIPNVKQCIAIASGKGGVGKSTVALNLAVALAQSGARVGLMDADVYGPSIPMMTGTQKDRPLTKDQKIVPIERFGILTMSLGYLMEEGQGVLWRGPMVAATVKQLLVDVLWGELDYLIVDLPPGTGDAPMSLAQLVPLTGVAIVSTPQTVAANIAGKCAALFRRLNSPILGVVENMADYACPNCGDVSRIFRGLDGEKMAADLKVPYLGSIPLDPAVGLASEAGQPAILAAPDSLQAQAFRAVAGRLAAQASIVTAARTQ